MVRVMDAMVDEIGTIPIIVEAEVGTAETRRRVGLELRRGRARGSRTARRLRRRMRK